MIGILQNFTGALAGATWQDTSRIEKELILTRVYGTLPPLNPNLFGGWLVVSFPIVFGRTILNISENRRV